MDLEIRNLSHHYDKLEVLRDINITIPSGQVVCVVGPSGCGKSTLIRL
ncbi:MAG: ATP-binding cassette domain-containing protein, partial [Nitratireductor sp.]